MSKILGITINNVKASAPKPYSQVADLKSQGIEVPQEFQNEEVVLVSLVVPKKSVFTRKDGTHSLSLVAFERDQVGQYGDTHAVRFSFDKETSAKIKTIGQSHPKFRNFCNPFVGDIKPLGGGSNSSTPPPPPSGGSFNDEPPF